MLRIPIPLVLALAALELAGCKDTPKTSNTPRSSATPAKEVAPDKRNKLAPETPKIAPGTPKVTRKTPQVEPMKPKLVAPERAIRHQAVQAFMSGDKKKGLRLGQRYLKTHPDDQIILAVVGAAACALERAGDARRAFAKLQSARRALLKQVCERSGISLP